MGEIDKECIDIPYSSWNSWIKYQSNPILTWPTRHDHRVVKRCLCRDTNYYIISLTSFDKTLRDIWKYADSLITHTLTNILKHKEEIKHDLCRMHFFDIMRAWAPFDDNLKEIHFFLCTCIFMYIYDVTKQMQLRV